MASTKRFGSESLEPKERPDMMALGVGGAGRNIINTLVEDQTLSNIKMFEVGSSDRLPKLPFIEVSRNHMRDAYETAAPLSMRPLSHSEEKIIRRLEQTEILYLISGLGGETGSWTAPICAQLAEDMNLFTISLIAMPFETENENRRQFAHEAKTEMEKHSDILGCFSNSKLLKLNPHLPMTKAFEVMNTIIRLPIQDFNTVLTKEDVPYLKKFCSGNDVFHIGAGYGKGRERGRYAAREALRSPWLEDMHEYSTILTVVTSGTGYAEMEAQDALETLRDVSPDSDIMWGLRKDPDIGDRAKVTMLAGK